VRYSYHICGDIGHKNIDCPKYNDMQIMFKNKGVKTIDKQVVVEPKVTIPLVTIWPSLGVRLLKNMFFKDREPIKKFAID